jgi:succinoglycan biosynthesis transport protein ExoP
MSLSQFFAILMARQWMIIAAVLASLAGAVVVIMLVPPRYTADTRVLLDVIKPDPVTGQVMSPQFARAYTQTQIQLIQDSRVAGAVVDDIGWSKDPSMLARYAVPGDPNGARRALAQLIIDRTSAKLIEGSNIMEIGYTGSSPDSARAIADAIRRAYIHAAVQTKRDTAAESADWYEAQAGKAQRLLNIAEDTKAQFERQHGLIMQDDKTDIDTQRLAALSAAGAAPVMSSVGPAATVDSAAATELASVDAQLAQASRTLGANNPVLIQLRQKRAALATQVSQERAAAGAAAAAAKSAAGAANSGTAALQAQKARVLANSENLAKLRQLQNDVDVRRDQFVKATQAAAQLRAQSATDDAGVTVLSDAVAPESPSFPKIPIVILGAFALGLALGLLAALLTELLNRRLRTVRDLQDVVQDAPLLAVIGPAAAKKRRSWKSFLGRRTDAEEALAA